MADSDVPENGRKRTQEGECRLEEKAVVLGQAWDQKQSEKEWENDDEDHGCDRSDNPFQQAFSQCALRSFPSLAQHSRFQKEMYLADCAAAGICLIRSLRIRPKSRGFLEASGMPCKLCQPRFPTRRKFPATTPRKPAGWRSGRHRRWCVDAQGEPHALAPLPSPR